MSEIICKVCQASDDVKNSTVRGLQRYRCKACGCNFTGTPPRGKPAAVKALAVLLYAMGNMSFRGIGRLFGVSDVAVLNWIRKEAEALPAPDVPANAGIMLLDEMHHFLKKSQQNYGTGERMILSGSELSPGFWAAVMMPHAESSSKKPGSEDVCL